MVVVVLLFSSLVVVLVVVVGMRRIFSDYGVGIVKVLED